MGIHSKFADGGLMRVVNWKDFITHTPSRLFGFRHVGSEIWWHPFEDRFHYSTFDENMDEDSLRSTSNSIPHLVYADLVGSSLYHDSYFSVGAEETLLQCGGVNEVNSNINGSQPL